jgi:ADP-ribosylglycohydrolase
MLGAIAGDVIGSVHEFAETKTTRFPLFTPSSTFTDDTVLTVAVASAILHKMDYAAALKHYGRQYPNAGYGVAFRRWLLSSDQRSYGSYGNGSAMRVSPVGFAFDSVESVLVEAERSAAVTHDHPEGIKGAQATALAVFLARAGEDKLVIKQAIEDRFGYDLSRSLEVIRPHYRFNETCQGTVPEAIIAFLDSTDYEDAVRNAISLGGDADTLACITGGIAQAYYRQIPERISRETRRRLPAEFVEVLEEFGARFG